MKLLQCFQFSSNEQILHKHVKQRENMDFYTDFYTDLWVYGFIRIFNFWKNGFLPLLSGNNEAFSVVSRTCQYTIYYMQCECVCILRIECRTWLIPRVTLRSKTKDRMWKSNDRSSVFLRVGSAASPPYSLDTSPYHEIKRTVQRLKFSDFKWPKFGHDPTYPRAEFQWPTWWCQEASRSLEMCHWSQGGLQWTT